MAGEERVEAVPPVWKQAMTYVEDVAPAVEPEGDWDPLMLLSGPDGVTVTLFDPRFFSDEAKKSLLITALCSVIHTTSATSIALVHNAWGVNVAAGTELGVRPSEHPDRREVVMVFGADHETMNVYEAVVKRREGMHPVLGAWSEHASPDYEGRMATPLFEALREVAGTV